MAHGMIIDHWTDGYYLEHSSSGWYDVKISVNDECIGDIDLANSSYEFTAGDGFETFFPDPITGNSLDSVMEDLLDMLEPLLQRINSLITVEIRR